MREIAVHAVEIYLLIVTVDLFLAWVQTDPARPPRRFFHALTEPLQVPLRRLLQRPPSAHGGLPWDFSALVVIVCLGLLRVWLIP